MVVLPEDSGRRPRRCGRGAGRRRQGRDRARRSPRG
jgi:hypothetical protein